MLNYDELRPETQRSLEQARRNYDFYLELRNSDRHLDWAATILFYSAVHHVNEHGAEREGWRVILKGDVYEGHRMRFEYIRKALATVLSDYDRLYELSRDARYRCFSPTLERLSLSEQQFGRIRTRRKAFGISWKDDS